MGSRLQVRLQVGDHVALAGQPHTAAPLSIGIIGCGRVVEQHYAPALRSIPGVRIAALADVREERREVVGQLLAVGSRFDSADAMLEEVRPDAVIVATTPGTHADLVTAALQAGASVLVEKPLATSPADAFTVLSAAASAGRCAMVGFNRRFWVPVIRLREMIAGAGSIEDVRAHMVMRTDLLNWHAVSGVPDVLDDLGCHQLDLIRYLFQSEIVSIRSVWLDSSSVRMEMRLEDGPEVTCIASHSAPSVETISIEAAGIRYRATRGSDRIRPAMEPWRQILDKKDLVVRKLTRRPSTMRDTFRRQVQAFVDSIRTGNPPVPGIGDGVAAVKAVAAARRSCEANGREIHIEEISD